MMISHGDVNLILDEALFVTNIVEPEARGDENVPSASIPEEIPDDVVVTKVTKLVATSYTALKRRKRSMANQAL
ncbi:hypothetical protein PVK06_026806 [Gossypium arboreum]|uniref:Uncharacterized protein n=1 Tax=Gossypium arboreum TaxID=29729 RepID=A0ABR0NYQ1_GOSAR|nr:hypothetical protein PVK06_026806 [Gossypium arboreum]